MAHELFWTGFALLCGAWAGLGLVARASVRQLLIAGAVWAVPLFLGPALFSGDMYSYYAQGDLLRLGIDPYHHGPAALHGGPVFAAVSPFWRHTTAPYGPLFVGLAAVVSVFAGSHVVLGVMLLRLLELPGLILLAVYVPRLARALGADPDRAVWLAVASPLVLLELVGGGHNDALMAGLLVAGLCHAVERRWVVALLLCTCAGLIKLPAFAAVAFVAVAWARSLALSAGGPASARTTARVFGVCAGIVVGSAALVGLVTGVGIGWASGSLLSTPGKVHLAITPSTALGYTLHAIFGAGGSDAAHPWESAVGGVTLALTVVLGAWLLWRADLARLVPSLGALLLASVLGGPASWPWYLAWGLALLAIAPQTQRHLALPVLIVVASAVIGPGGQVALSIESAPYVLAVYVAALGLIMFGQPRRPQAVGAPARRGGLRPSGARMRGIEVSS